MIQYRSWSLVGIVRRGDKILIDQRYARALLGGLWEFPGGKKKRGETLAECVRREVREETGVEVTNVRYVGSQSWPFPSQQMIGFVADYAGGTIKMDEAELEDANERLQELDRKTGKWSAGEPLPENRQVKVKLDPGDGRLFRTVER